MQLDRGSGCRISVSSRIQHTTLPLALATLLAPQAQLIVMATWKANMVEQEITRQHKMAETESMSVLFYNFLP